MAGKLTEIKARDAAIPATGEATIWDGELKGFGLRMRAPSSANKSGVKTWIVKYRTRTGQQRKHALGPCPTVKADDARRQARDILGQVAKGREPVGDERRTRTEEVTLGQALEAYLAARVSLKPVTTANYRRVIAQHFGDWSVRPLAAINSDAVLARHQDITKRVGPAAANLSMRVLSAVFTFATVKYRGADQQPVFIYNPVRLLAGVRAWNKPERRQRVIKPHELLTWWAAVQKVASPLQRDYLVLVLLTGLRRREAAGLRWDEVDLAGRTLTIAAGRVKNGNAHALPVAPYLLDMLLRRQAEATGSLVFPGERGSQLSTYMLTARVAAESRIPCTIHDLRRTFSTIAESLDIPHYALKRLLNHAGADVTSGYLIIDTERLRKPMEAIENYILSAVGETPSNVVTLLSGART